MSFGTWSAWPLPPSILTLPADQLHVWAVSLQVTASEWARLYATLSADERARAERYRFEEGRQRFVVARGLLRAILGLYCRLEPQQICFRYHAHGKPELDTDRLPLTGCRSPVKDGMRSAMGDQSPVGGCGDRIEQTMPHSTLVRSIRSENPLTASLSPSAPERLRFNLTHSDDLALYVMARGRRVGIDLERIRAGFADDTLAEHFFSPREVAVLRALPAKHQQRAFFACWTRKEAYLKARGEGLVMPMDSFSVSLAPDESAALLETPADPPETARWSLCGLDLGPYYVATLAVEGHDWELSCWRWSNP